MQKKNVNHTSPSSEFHLISLEVGLILDNFDEPLDKTEHKSVNIKGIFLNKRN